MQINEKKFKIEFVTDLNLSKNNSEIRPTTIKGLLRFWWRILYKGNKLTEMYRKESEIFGSTVKASNVILDVEYSQNNFKAGHTFDLFLEYPKNFEDEINKTLRLWITFGGIGAKQYLGYGKLYSKDIPYIENENLDEFNIKDDYYEIKSYSKVENILKSIESCYKDNKNLLNDKKNKPFFVGINKYEKEYKLKLLYYRKLELYKYSNIKEFFQKFCDDLKERKNER